MTIKVNRHFLKEGDIVEVEWNCVGMDDPQLLISNGYKTVSLAVDSVGSKKFRLKRNKYITKIVIQAKRGGQPDRKSTWVWVHGHSKESANENGQSNGKQYDQYTRVDHHSFGEKIKWFKDRVKYTWKSFSPEKRQTYILLWCLLALLIAASFWPKVLYIGVSAIVVYLFLSLATKN